MPEYTLYCLETYKLVRCERFAAADDEAAIQEALRLRAGEAAELWCGTRRVRTFDKGGNGQPDGATRAAAAETG